MNASLLFLTMLLAGGGNAATTSRPSASAPCAKDFVYDKMSNRCLVRFVFQIQGARNFECVKVAAAPPAELGLECTYTPTRAYITKRGKP